MIDKLSKSAIDALSDLRDGSTVLISGFGGAGVPGDLIDALVALASKGLTVVSNNAGNGVSGIAALLAAGCVEKVVCSFPRQADSYIFDDLYRAGKVDLELVPQGTLAERIRAGGAGIGAFFTPTGYGTELAKGKESRVIGGKPQVLEYAIRGDFALVKADRGDRWGNLTFRKSARNFGPIMAGAAAVTIAQVARLESLGSISPEHIVTPGVFVKRVVQERCVCTEEAGNAAAMDA